MKKILMLLGVLALVLNSFSQHYISSGDGVWTNSSTWNLSSSPSLSGTAGRMSDSVTISQGDTVTLSSNLELQSGAVLLVYGYLDLSGDVTFKNGCYVKVFSGGTLRSQNGIQSNNSSDIYVDGSLICNGNYNAGTGSSITGSGSFEVTGTLTNDGNIMGSTEDCTECNIEVGAVSESNSITDGSTEGLDALMDCWYRYNYSQSIYLQSEIGPSCVISKIYFEWDGYTSTSEDWVIYLGNTSKSSFSSSSDWISTSNMTQVFSGSVTYPSTAGWVEIVLDTEFEYDSLYNLVVAVDENSYGYPGSSADFYSVSVSTYRNLMYDNDNTNPDPNSPPTYADARQKYVPSFKMFSKVVTPPIWTGGASTTDWNTALNWNIGAVPTASTDVTIPSTSFNPVITGTFSSNNLTIESGAQLTISGSGSLSVNGDVDISGTLSHTSSGSITLNKSGGTLAGTGSQLGAKYIIGSGGNYTLNDSWSVTDMNINSGGQLDVATTKTLTLSSDLTNSGTLTCSGSGSIIADNVTLSGTTTLGSGTLDVNGNYSNTGTFTAGTSTFKLSGGSAQTINNTNLTVTYASSSGTPVSVFTEDFENGGYIPTGWSQEYVTSTNSWDYEDGAGYTTPGAAHGGSWNALLFATRGSRTKLITPVIDLSSYNSATLKFWHAQTNWGGDQDELRIYYKTSSGGSWTLISGAEWTSEVSSWTQRTVSLPNINSTYYIAFEGHSDYGHGVVLDDVEVEGSPLLGVTLSLGNEFYNVVVNNSNGISLATSELGFSNNLTLTSGVITTGTDDTVYIENSSASAMPAGSSSSFINGNVKFSIAENTSTYTIPLGDGTASNNYYRVDLDNNNLTGTNFITARMVSGSPSGYDASALNSCNTTTSQSGITSFQVKSISSESHLKLTPSSQPSGGSYGLKLYTENFDKSTWVNNKVAIVKRNEGSNNNCDWSIAGTLPADDATGRMVADSYLSFSGETSFSEFGPGGEGGGALPIQLVSFEGECDGNSIRFEWITASEINNDYFELFSSIDGEEWISREIVNGSGTSIYENDYSAVISNLRGHIYYKLRQYDYNEDYEDFIIVVDKCTEGSKVVFLEAYDILGRAVRFDTFNKVIFKKYSDGSIKKVFIIR